jgi:superfamily II DNA or RNA helicase
MIHIGYDKSKKLGIISGDLFQEIREHFSVKNDAAHFAKRFNRFIPSRTYAITPNGRFEPGMYNEIRQFILSKDYVGDIVVEREFTDFLVPAISTWHTSPKYTCESLPLLISLRDYQREIVKRSLQYGRGTILLATAGGKTLTAASILTNIFFIYGSKFKCLFIVPDRGLVEQTSSDFEQYGVPFTVSKWTGDDALNRDTNIIVANIGIMQSKNTDLSWLSEVDVLFIDECHRLRKGNEINSIFKQLKTPHRFGLTGTMPEGLLDQWNITGKIGPVIFKKESIDLRNESYISGVEIQILKLKHQAHKLNLTYREEIETLITSDYRNTTISTISSRVQKNALVLVDYIEHGKRLYDYITKVSPEKQVFFIHGDISVEEREKVRQLMESTDNVVVVAISKIFSTGINIKNLHYIIFACGGKAKVKIVQSIGRGLRLHKDKDKLVIFDIADSYHYSLNHLEKRILLYEKEHIKFSIKEIEEKRAAK